MRDGVAIYVLVDALGWEILRGRSFLDDLLPHRRPLETILGYSSGAIPTLLTGQHPRDHGHWNLFYRSPRTSPFRWTWPLLYVPPAVRESRVVRRLVKEVSHRVSGYSGYFAIYNLPLDRIRHYDICETSDIYLPGGLAPARSLFDRLTAAGVGYECFNYHRYSDAQTLALVPDRLATSDCRVYFLYLSELDSYLHFHVQDAEGVTAKLRWYEDGLRRIHDAAVRRWGRARLHLFSDHGMTPTRATYDLIRDVERLELRVGADYLPAYDSTMARFWCESDRARKRLGDVLGDRRCGRLLSALELKQLGLDFDDDRYGQMVFVMEPGTLIVPSDMGRIRLDGMHGYHPREDPSAYAALLTSDPIDLEAAHISDVLSVLLTDLGLGESAT
jgi:type I phosphodiesterase/nucleotide pyrophosphatase